MYVVLAGAISSWPDEESPLDYINHAAYCLACAVKSKKMDANAHLQLGLVLEERYLAEDIYDLKKAVSDMLYGMLENGQLELVGCSVCRSMCLSHILTVLNLVVC